MSDDTMSVDFRPFPKITRLSREALITEKIDGTNAQVMIVPADQAAVSGAEPTVVGTEFTIYAGSRNRWITPADDNFGFAAWVLDHAEEITLLGPGRHFGEWWGSGIQRGYGLAKGEKRWSLFNTMRWHSHGETPRVFASPDPRAPPKTTVEAPACVSVVPVLYQGEFSTVQAQHALDSLGASGSIASPGFMSPEGIVVFHVAGGIAFKKTLDRDGQPKGVKA